MRNLKRNAHPYSYFHNLILIPVPRTIPRIFFYLDFIYQVSDSRMLKHGHVSIQGLKRSILYTTGDSRAGVKGDERKIKIAAKSN